MKELIEKWKEYQTAIEENSNNPYFHFSKLTFEEFMDWLEMNTKEESMASMNQEAKERYIK